MQTTRRSRSVKKSVFIAVATACCCSLRCCESFSFAPLIRSRNLPHGARIDRRRPYPFVSMVIGDAAGNSSQGDEKPVTEIAGLPSEPESIEAQLKASQEREARERRHAEEAENVMRANAEFYSAWTDKDLEQMEKLWRKDEFIECIHPGAPIAEGHANVIKMFRRLFANRDVKYRRTRIVPLDTNVYVRGVSAWVTCTEEMVIPGQQGQGSTKIRQCATNIFRKAGKGWQLIHHHASPYPSASSGNSIGDLLSSGLLSGAAGGGGGPRIIQISGNSEGVDQRAIDEIVKSIRGAIEERKGQSQPMGLGALMNLQSGKIEGGEGLKRARIIGGGQGNEGMEVRLMVAQDEEEDDGRDLTRRTVSAIRDAFAAGKISNTEKRVLLTDVIRMATGEKCSYIEVAHELLLAEDNETEEGEENKRPTKTDLEMQEALDEFAQQCKAFAASFILQEKRREERNSGQDSDDDSEEDSDD